MLKVLIIGGYGTFGGWVARLLADEPRLHLLIAGRTLHKAKVFTDRYGARARMTPVEFDRDSTVLQQIRKLAPDIIVDASGPFQAYGTDPYRVVKAAIESGAHYLDIADTSAFVCEIEQYNANAKAQKVFALSGVSTCVALSSVVFRRLTQDLHVVKSMRGGIAPSPYSGVGLSVMRAVAHSAGKPVQAIKGDRLTDVYPFTDSKSFTIAAPGCLPLRPRIFSLVDVPDLRLAKIIDAKTESVWFGAAPVPGIYHALLRALARAVKRGWIGSIEKLSPLMFRAMRDWSWGEHRGGMFIEVCGETDSSHNITRRWHLVAEGDDGPAIPAMASAMIVRHCIDGCWPAAGARAAVGELELEDFEKLFTRMKIHTGIRTKPIDDSWPLFRRLLDTAWTALPVEIRKLHEPNANPLFSGRASVTRGVSSIARLIAQVVGFPAQSSDVPVNVNMKSVNGREHWNRNFDGHSFSSVMSQGKGAHDHVLLERFGPVTIMMALVLDDGRLNYVSRGWKFLGLPMPQFLAPRGTMCEYVEEGKFHFCVEINLPVVGHLVTYKGWLRPDSVIERST